MLLIERYIVSVTQRLVLTLAGFLIFIFASYSAQRYLTDAVSGTLALKVVFDIICYKVLIALEMLLPVALYVAVGVTLGQLWNDSEITAIFAAGASPLRLYKAVMIFAIPLAMLVMLLSLFVRPWAYGQVYRLEQQSQSELDVNHLIANKFNVNDDGRMILAGEVDSANSTLCDVLIYTPSAHSSRVYRAHTVGVLNPSPNAPSVMLHAGTSDVLEYQGAGDNQMIYRHMKLQLKPLRQNPALKRKSAPSLTLSGSRDPADRAELQWRESRGINTLLMALLAIPLSRIKPRQGRFATLLPLTVLFTLIFYGGNLSRTLVANGTFALIPGVWILSLMMFLGLLLLMARDFSLWQRYRP